MRPTVKKVEFLTMRSTSPISINIVDNRTYHPIAVAWGKVAFEIFQKDSSKPSLLEYCELNNSNNSSNDLTTFINNNPIKNMTSFCLLSHHAPTQSFRIEFYLHDGKKHSGELLSNISQSHTWTDTKTISFGLEFKRILKTRKVNQKTLMGNPTDGKIVGAFWGSQHFDSASSLLSNYYKRRCSEPQGCVPLNSMTTKNQWRNRLGQSVDAIDGQNIIEFWQKSRSPTFAGARSSILLKHDRSPSVEKFIGVTDDGVSEI